jgi:hypothetical protein
VSDLEEIKANLASLNEIVAELASVYDAGFNLVVRETLRNHSWRLGYEFQGEPVPWQIREEQAEGSPGWRRSRDG